MTGADDIEKDVITTILCFPDWSDLLLEALSEDGEDFQDSFLRGIFLVCKDRRRRGLDLDAAEVCLSLDESATKNTPDPAKAMDRLINGPNITSIDYAVSRLKAERQRRHYCELLNAAAKSAEAGELAKAEDFARRMLAADCAPTLKPKDPPFPYDVMLGAAGNYTAVHSELIEAHPAFIYFAYLTCLGSVLSKRVRLRSILQTQPRLYVAIVGESGADRKSTVIGNVVRFFNSAIEGGLGMTWGVGSAEGLQLSLQQKCAGGSGLLLALDELKALVSKCGIEGSILLPCINTLFESNQYHNATKAKAVAIENAYLSVLAASTLQTYERLYNSAFTDIGFPNRVFLVVGGAERKYAIPKQIDPADHRELVHQLGSILKAVGDHLEMGVHPDAEAFYSKWYMNLERSIHARRLDTYSLRLAMLLSLNQGKREIDLEAVEHATMLCDWQLAIRKIYDPIDADNAMAAMEQRIKRTLLKFGPMRERELKRKVNSSRSGSWLFEKAANNLRHAGELEYNGKLREWRLLE